MVYYIYAIQNIINNKTYIGKTTQVLGERTSDHRYKLNTNTHTNLHLQFAYNKYGKENFIFYKVKEYYSEIEMDNNECYFISIYKELNLSYNIKNGGEGGPLSEETKKRISESNKKKFNAPNFVNPNTGRKHTEESKQKMSEAQKLRAQDSNFIPPFLGKKHTQETLEKMSQSKMGHTITEETRQKLVDSHLGQKAWNKEIPCREETKQKLSKIMKEMNANPNFNHPCKCIIKTEEERKIMSKRSKDLGLIPPSRKGCKLTEEHKELLSKINSGTGNPMYGRKQTPEAIAKQKASRQRNKPLKQQETDSSRDQI